ncbi:biotin--[acetyl-CoA-carboxylase] ligase [Granulosicoccus sp. 3-233]
MNTQLPNASLIQEQVRALCSANVEVHAFEQLDSTSVWLREHARDLVMASESALHVCITDWQSAGVGRRGKAWQAQAGNLMFSLLAHSDKPARELIGLSLVTGIAVAETLQATANIRVQLKWPNDLILADAKLGGLITELSPVSLPESMQGTQLLTGIGINLLHDEEILRLSIGATSLEAAGVACSRMDRDAMAARLIAGILTAHHRFEEAGWSAFAQRWAALDWLRGKEVLIHRDKSTEQAVARGVNEQGALLVERAGEITPVYSGNVSIRPTV